MAKTIRRRVLEEVKALLDASEKPEVGTAGVQGSTATPTVHRSRSTPLEDDDLPAVAVFAVEDQVLEEDMEGLEHRFRVAVEARVKTKDELQEPADDLLEELVGWVVPVLMADPTLGGTIRRLRYTGVEWAPGRILNQGFGAAQVLFEPRFSAPDDDETTTL